MRPSLVLAAAAAACAAALAPGAAGAAPYSFLTTQTDQLGVPGQLAGGELTPEGYVYSGFGEVGFRFGPDLGRWSRSNRTLASGRYPVYSSTDRRAGVAYRLEVLASELAGRPVALGRVTMTGVSRGRATARWGLSASHEGARRKRSGAPRFRYLRPATPERDGLYAQAGERFARGARYDFGAHGALQRDGRPLFAGRVAPGAPLRVSHSALPRGRRAGRRTEVGRSVWTGRLKRGSRARIEFVVPLDPLPQGDPVPEAAASARFDDHRAAEVERWRSLLAGAMRIDVPEPKVEQAFDANLVSMAVPRYRLPDGRWVQAVNKLQYHAFWLRDAAIMSNAFDLAGLHSLAAENLEFFLGWQRSDGLFISRPEQYDGMGQTLWAFGEHVRRTGDRAFAARVLPAVGRAVDWIRRERERDPLGLLPSANLYDNELANGHIVGDNFWALIGLQQAAHLAREAGNPVMAELWSGEARALRSALDGALGPATSRTGGWIPPTVESRRGQDWGNAWSAWPLGSYEGERSSGAYSADHPWVRATLAHIRGKFREGIATYANGTLLHGYLGFRVFQTELQQGRQRNVINGLYDSLTHTTASHGAFETGVRVYGSRSVDDNMAPHGWFAAEYVSLLRNMLVREEGERTLLMSAVSPEWLRPGRRIAVRNAPTIKGPVSFTLRARRGGATLSWDTGLPAGAALRWPVPEWVKASGGPLSPDGSEYVLDAPSGSIRLNWRLRGPRLSYAHARSALLRAYARRSG